MFQGCCPWGTVTRYELLEALDRRVFDGLCVVINRGADLLRRKMEFLHSLRFDLHLNFLMRAQNHPVEPCEAVRAAALDVVEGEDEPRGQRDGLREDGKEHAADTAAEDEEADQPGDEAGNERTMRIVDHKFHIGFQNQGTMASVGASPTLYG